jgi:hypothetical protein
VTPLFLIALASVAGPAQSGSWVHDYADAQCSARHQFGTAEKPTFLIIKPSPTSELVQLNVVKKKGVGSGALELDARIGLAGESIRLRQLSYTNKGFDVRQVNLPGGLAARLASADRVTWSAPDANMTFETGPLGPVMQQLADCREKMRAHWNIGTADEQALRAPVKIVKPLVSLFSSGDYPKQSLRQGDSGISSVIVLIDEQGRPLGCMLDATSGIASLDSMACAVIRSRGKFKPAIGADGRPTKSYIAQRVRWLTQ